MEANTTTQNTPLTTVSRVLIFICGLGLLVVLFAPIWKIDLMAPQYPEGLNLLIYANKLAGNVDIINGLNHYIGMKTLHADDFVEFKILPGIIVFFSVLFMLVALIGKRKWANLLLMLFVGFGVLAMVDFWRWEYNYGHNLDPNAAIIVPGMSYQPPLIGFKQLLNFGAYSMPHIGAWIFIATGIVLLSVLVYEWKRFNKLKGKRNKSAASTIGAITLLLSACSTGPEPIRIGKDNCHFCKMTISDNRFGAEITTKKGKVFKFDDTHCIGTFLKSKTLPKEEIAGVYFSNFYPPHQLIKAEEAYFLQSPALKSPMNGNIAAFTHQDRVAKAVTKFYGNFTTWEDMQK